MNVDVVVGDRVRTVSVVRKGELLHVTLDGQTYVVDARRVSDTALSLLVQNGTGELPVQSIDAAFAQQSARQLVRRNGGEGGNSGEGGPGAGDFDVHLAGRAIAVQLRPAGSFGRQKKQGGGVSGSGPQRVVAPMPGKITRVLVKPGDAVTARQGLVVVEAMKMENELRAARDGRVRELSVAEGQSVDAGAVLVVVD